MSRPLRPFLLALALGLAGTAVPAEEIAPRAIETDGAVVQGPHGRYSDSTLRVAVIVDRDGASVVGVRRAARPFVAPVTPEKGGAERTGSEEATELEVVLLGPASRRYTRTIAREGLCLAHGADAEPHVLGDTVRVHRDGFVVELPDLPGFDRIEVALQDGYRGTASRRSLGVLGVDSTGAEKAAAVNTVHWPEEFGDGDVVRVFGNAAEGANRVNIVIVPDGYTYIQKALMEQHALELVTKFRSSTPFGEHDRLINYNLVYAYSNESGTDECDCGTLRDTAMGARFPVGNGQCGHTDNRCLYVGGGCDDGSIQNILEAELRAPYQDETVVMVNTARYGGCGGSRAVYSAGISSGSDIALHEMGHSLAGLADEYAYTAACGVTGGEVNTSVDKVDGAWPEWIEDIGSPREGARYYQSCLFRPEPNCEMRSLGQLFCRVCRQRIALVLYGHPRVAPSAPIARTEPAPFQTVDVGEPVEFSVGTRLAAGAGVTHDRIWRVQPPGGGPAEITATGTDTFATSFPDAGDWVVSCEVVADTNFIKPERYGANRDTATWQVTVENACGDGDGDGFGSCADCDDGSPVVWELPGEASALAFDVDKQTVSWDPAPPGGNAGGVTYTLLRSGEPGFADAVCLPAGTQTSRADPDVPLPGALQAYLAIARNGCGSGSAGSDTSGAPRVIPDCP